MHRQPILTSILLAASGPLLAQVLYVPNSADANISAYVFDSDAGSLTELLPRTPVTGRPLAIVAHPSGRFLFMTNGVDPNRPNSVPSVSATAT